MKKRKQKQPTDASDRNKMDLDNNSTELECGKSAITMCRVGVFPCLRDLPLPTSSRGVRGWVIMLL